MSAMVKRRKRLSIDEDRAEPELEEMSYLNTAASQLSWGLLQRLSGRLEDGEEEREERSQSRLSPRQSNSAEQTGALWSSSEISRIKRTMHNGKTTNIKSWLLMALLAGSMLALGSLTRAGDAPGRRLPAGADSERQLQLLRSANVELSRSRGQRHQRDTPSSAEPTAITATAPTCGYPGSPAHASVTFNTSHVVAGTAASYTCDNGYELLGPPRRLCQANGTWSPVGIPFCVLNVGLGKAAMQSSTVGPGSAQKAVDGSTSPYFQISTCTETDAEHNPWWYVNLLEPYLVQIVRIDFGRACCGNRQKATIAVRVGNNRPDLGNNPLCNRYHGFIEEGKPLFLPCTRPAPGAFVSIHLESPSGFQLSICETFIYTDHEQCPSFRDQPLGSTATYNGKCYLFHNNQALNFDGARKYCESRGGTLVDETSPALQGFLSWELYRRHRTEQTNGQYWLGAVRDSRNPQLWKWINGKEVQISFWNSVAQQGNCSRFDGNKGWLWTDTDCNQKLNFICQYRPLSCGKPEKPTNSTLITRNIDNGTVIEYQCAPGNLLMGPKSRACLPTGFFSEFAPKCKYLDCQFPAMIPNGDYKLLNGTTSYQSVVSYFCQEGYQIYGKPVLSCDVDERWNGPPPRCEPMLCPAVQAPSNGYITVTQKINMPGTQATYECRPGYELVGDQLLTCLPSGSWDNSFPYCREKRPLLPPVQLGVSTSSTPATPSNPSTTALAPSRPAQRPSGGLRPSSAVQFPTGTNTPFSSNRLPVGPPASTTNAPTPTQPPSTNSMPASLNGIASQFNQQSPATSSVNINDQLTSTGSPVTPAADQQQTRKAAQSNSVSQFALPPSGSQSFVELSPTATSPSSALPTESSNQRSVSKSTTTATTFNTMAGQPTTTGATSPNNNIRQQQATSPANKFTYGSPSSTAFDSSPLATTNSISVHQQQQQQQTPSSTPAPSFTLSSMPSGGRAVPTNQNVLASFSPPVRAHNTLAGAKYSLDGIIAVAIFGGFIFLGAIITIIVIIIRRRKSNHSAIDAQTISTYDSNGEHNGLYRNYQQAWENLRFASPANQPKSSGGGQGGGLLGGNGTGLITAHVNGGPSVGLKNFASPTVHMIHHAHQLQHPHHHHAHHNPLLQGHHNLAMAQSASSSSSQDGSSVMDDQTQVGVNPLLRNPNNQGGPNQQHRAHHHHHHSHSQLARRSMVVEDEDEVDTMLDDADEQGVLSTDESNYRPISGDHQQQAGEGFRDTNELTIEAEQVLNGSGARRRLYSASNPVGGGQSRVQNRPLSMASVAHGHHHHHHHHHHGSSGGSSQHQRLVGSSTPSTSTRSSRASPPSDDQSLERLAYGTNWHQATGNQNNSGSGSSQDQTSGGSSASILGPNASRSNLRYN